MAAVACNYRSGCGSALRQVRSNLWKKTYKQCASKDLLSIEKPAPPWWRGAPPPVLLRASTPWSAWSPPRRASAWWPARVRARIAPLRRGELSLAETRWLFQVPNYRSSFFVTGDLAHGTWHSGSLLSSNGDLPGEPRVRDRSALLQHQLQRALQRRRVHGSLQELSKDPRKAESSSKVGHLHLWRFEIELRFYKGKHKLVVLWQRQHCDKEEKTEWRKRSPNARSVACRKRFLSENSTFQVLLS